ncbi:pilin/secretion family protein with methylation motif [Halanaerobium saccharolyticum]|uniref:Pilin/secretion family protein with methylation motif n=1 Tax=Halanaerobium saccharolyticum TaxID=43595 RepID=A0A4R7YUC5_9FIRM|nr:prepilin-type N-terminal cleavage/methylation domain-containing protein [Halanaerobium saccharolyticum]RAK06713.1 pilin/secretion family protein with methylation motif [Halanaerobium saccharolyticum]TDW01350.1 pilin/secretion family protein with methylation motif [Halanaerobium saccharolyticum]TDX52818.1 pilin/secretion family protein with methylation motif [Halanaerobium saccharolyticum]
MKNNRGFTLVEVLITFTILIIVLTLMGTILVQSFDIFRDSTERVSNNRLTQIMIEDISQNIRESKYFDFTTTDSWKFWYDEINGDTEKADFEISKNNNEFELKKKETEDSNLKIERVLENVLEFKLKNYVSEKIILYKMDKDGTGNIEFKNGNTIGFEDDKLKFTDDIKIEYVDSSGTNQEKNITGGTEIRLIEGNEIRLEDNTKIHRDNVRKIIVDGTEINFNNNAFEFKIRIDLGNNNVIEELKTVYPRNLSFWR